MLVYANKSRKLKGDMWNFRNSRWLFGYENVIYFIFIYFWLIKAFIGPNFGQIMIILFSILGKTINGWWVKKLRTYKSLG